MSDKMSRQMLLAWSAHAFTASGVLLGFMALIEILNGELKDAMFWLAAALVVDGVDGAFARKARVQEHLPDFDGATLDNIIDYFTYVIIPAFYIFVTDAVPAGWALPAAALILLSSQYHFADLGHKTVDNYFKGFPALWNLVMFYFFIFDTGPVVTLITVFVFAALTFVPLKFTHPVRVVYMRTPSLIVTAVTLLAATFALWAWPEPGIIAKTILILSLVYFGALTIRRSLKGPDEVAP